jgi:hypothetical protein
MEWGLGHQEMIDIHPMFAMVASNNLIASSANYHIEVKQL